MSKDSIADLLNSAKKKKEGIYSDGPQVTSQQLKREVKAAEEDFSQVIDKELKRLKVFADQENERILELRRQNEDEITCPLCLEDIPSITMEGVVLCQQACCGVRCHQECYANWDIRARLDPTISSACFYCRRIMSDTTSDRDWMKFWEEMTLTGSAVSKAHALMEVGNAYEKGQGGKSRNSKKALKYYEKAAKLGNAHAQSRITVMCHYGLSVPKSPEKAMDMAQRAVDQGHNTAQAMLGIYRRDSGVDAATEAHRLFALSAYQGDLTGITELQRFYDRQFTTLRGKWNTSMQEIRECLLLKLYWAGRMCIKKEDGLSRSARTVFRVSFVSQFQFVMRTLWHERPCFELDPLTGYSHIPLLTSIDSVVRKGCHDKELSKYVQDEKLKNTLHIDIWKHICANCGKQGDKENSLKQCVRCKVFSYCSKECQVKHWKAGHKVDCKGHHWIESYFPNIRTS